MIVVGVGVLGVVAGATIGPTVGEILFGDKFNLGNVDLTLLFLGQRGVHPRPHPRAGADRPARPRPRAHRVGGRARALRRRHGARQLGHHRRPVPPGRARLPRRVRAAAAAMMLSSCSCRLRSQGPESLQPPRRGHRARAARDLISVRDHDPPGDRRHPAARAPHRHRRGRRRPRQRARRRAPRSRSSRTRSPGAVVTTCGRRAAGRRRRHRPDPRAPRAPGVAARASTRGSSAGPGRSTWCTRPTTSRHRPGRRRSGVGVRPRVRAVPRVRAPPTRSSTRRCSSVPSPGRVDPHHERLGRERGQRPVRRAARARSCACTPGSRRRPAAETRAGAAHSRGTRSLRARDGHHRTPQEPARCSCAPSTPPAADDPELATRRRRHRRRGAATRSTTPLGPTRPPRPGAAHWDTCRRRRSADLLAGASVLAYPSHYEGFGFPPLEAMAAGVPVVAAARRRDPRGRGRRRTPRRSRRRRRRSPRRCSPWCPTTASAPAHLVTRGRAQPRRFSVVADGRRARSTSYRAAPAMRAVVTGAHGFVGRHLAAHLVRTATRSS